VEPSASSSKKGKIKTALGVVALSCFSLGVGVPLFLEFRGSFAAKEFSEKGVWGTYRHHFFRFFGMVDELADMDRENGMLTQKLAELEKKVVLTETHNTERELASLNEQVEERLRDDAGSELATAKKNIEYEIPKNLSYNQLQVLALSFFNQKKYGPSALILNHLLSLKEETRYRIPENFLISGISWYHLKHFHLAGTAFKEARDATHPADESHRSAMVWLALVQKALGKRVLVQDSLLKILELYPHSEEAAMINGGRRPARVIHEPPVRATHAENTPHAEDAHPVEVEEASKEGDHAQGGAHHE